MVSQKRKKTRGILKGAAFIKLAKMIRQQLDNKDWQFFVQKVIQISFLFHVYMVAKKFRNKLLQSHVGDCPMSSPLKKLQGRLSPTV